MLRKCGAVFAGLMAFCLLASAQDKKAKTPSIEEIMKTVGGKSGLCAKCNTAGKGEKWEDAQKLAKQLTECGAALPKNDCPKGDAKSWAKLSKQYEEQTVAIKKAADAKDTKAFTKAIMDFTTSCKSCHDVHK